MSGSCHLDRASNVEFGDKCQIFVIVIFLNCVWVLQFGAHSRHYKGALTQKRSFLVICTTFRSDFCVGWKNQNKHSTLDSSFKALSKWHEPDLNNGASLPGLTPFLKNTKRFCTLSNLWLKKTKKNLSSWKSPVHFVYLKVYWINQNLLKWLYK